MSVQYSVQTRKNNSTTLLLLFLQSLGLLWKITLSFTPNPHSILKLYELVLALGVLWLPSHQAGNAHPFPFPLRSRHSTQTYVAALIRPTCSDGVYTAQHWWDPCWRAALATPVPPAALPWPLPVTQSQSQNSLSWKRPTMIKSTWRDSSDEATKDSLPV